jgi:hypothetical protein
MEEVMEKKIYDLVPNIYKVLETQEAAEGVDVEEVLEDFAVSMKEMLRRVITKQEDKRTLRMSNIGKTDRYLWLLHRQYKQEAMQPHTLMKFLYGHATEELVLALVKLAGHEVTNQQAKVNIKGISGSMDCCIDGLLVDVKTASSYGFKKFKEGTVRADDPFGYVAQLHGYATALGHTEGGWLAIDKGNGHLALHIENFKYDAPIEDRIDHLKEIVESNILPEQCHPEVPDGKSGNMKLAVGCSYCVFKQECFPTLKVFSYSTGPRFLTTVVNYPKVHEMYNYFD